MIFDLKRASTRTHLRSGSIGVAVGRTGWFLAAAILCQFLVSHVAGAQNVSTVTQPSSNEIPLPTPRSHYDMFKPGISGTPLLQELVKQLDPDTQKKVLSLIAGSGLLSSGSILNSLQANPLLNMPEAAGINKDTIPSKPQALVILEQVDWTPYRPVLLEFIVHQSQVFEMIPTKYQAFWYPIVHDALLYFLDHLPEDRLLEKLVEIAYLPPNSPRSADVIAFASKTPSLQKVGQIIARNPALPPDYKEALQQFENSIHSITRDELVQFITEDIGQSFTNQNGTVG